MKSKELVEIMGQGRKDCKTGTIVFDVFIKARDISRAWEKLEVAFVVHYNLQKYTLFSKITCQQAKGTFS
jgi:hypothetical protein